MKKILKIFIVFSMVASLAIPNTMLLAASEIQTGDYIEFGTYDSEPLLWQVIGFDQNGHGILWCESIIDMLAFDGAESGTSGSGMTDSDKYGSNQYYNSNIKEWLNSDSAYVDFTTTSPTTDAVEEFQSFDDQLISRAYDKKAGFLNGFSLQEKAALVTKEHVTKTVSANSDLNYTFSIGKIEEAYSLFNNGNTMVVEGPVFLLSIEELKTWALDHGISITKSLKGSLENEYYWLRTADGKSLSTVMTIDYNGNVFKTDANYSTTGVVPAIALNLELTPMSSGSGTQNNPYKLDTNKIDQIIRSTNSADINLIQQKVLEFKSSLDESSKTKNKELVARTIENEIMSSDVPSDFKVVYNYYMMENNLYLHRDLFTSKHLLTNQSLSKSKTFTDTSALSISQKEAINTLTSYGIIDGYTDGSFKPSKPVSRAEMSKIISLAAQLEQKTFTNEFSDMTGDNWFADYVASIKNQGIVVGYTDGTFKPYNTITYDEMSAIVSRVLKENNRFYEVDMTSKTLNDQSIVRDWAKGDVNLLLENELIDANLVYNGKIPMTRIDVVVLMDKLIKLIYE